MDSKSPKERMLAAYRGMPQERAPVAPEFWYYYPAKVLGVDMIAFEKEVPFWYALKETFGLWNCEGWGAAFAESVLPGCSVRRREERLEGGRYREIIESEYRERSFIETRIFDPREPSATETYPVKGLEDLSGYLEIRLSESLEYDLSGCSAAHKAVGGSYLIEFWLGLPFFDFLAESAGFETAVGFLFDIPEDELLSYRERYIEHMKRLVRRVCNETAFESFVIGCSSSCNSLLGPALWRKWDKPLIQAVAKEIHGMGRLLHIHFHGSSAETLMDFVDTGADCVCPFERPPGGDIRGIDGLREVRRALSDRVTMNGNVHTVETLIRGTQEDVRREVNEIKEAFAGSHRCIIGTGDQVGGETPPENIAAMIDEAKRV